MEGKTELLRLELSVLGDGCTPTGLDANVHLIANHLN